VYGLDRAVFICIGRTAIRLLTQLRFVFGRGYPAGLAPELNAGVIGHSKQADQLPN
jgi:hypothetical protein